MGESIYKGKTILLVLVLGVAHFEFIRGAAAPTAFVGQIRTASSSSSKYVTTIKLGTPPQLVTFTVDTDAEITRTSTAAFNPSKSSTYHPLMKKLSSDTATLNSTDGFVPTAPVKLDGIKFKLLSGEKDVLGLGAGALAFPAQVSAAARVAKKFAYCLGQNANSPTPIFFGNTSYYFDSGLPQQGNRYPELDITPLLTYTPLKAPAHGKRGYALNIASVTVNGGSAVTVKVGDAAAIGTGALYTRIVEPAYTHIRQAFLRVPPVTGFPRVSSHHGPLDLCFNISTVAQYRSAPLITFTFGGNSSVGVTADNYLVNVGSSTIYCFGIISAGAKTGSSMIGIFQQQDNLVEFDLEQQRVGMTGSLIAVRSNCANFNFTRT